MKASELMVGQRAYIDCGCLIEVEEPKSFDATKPGVYAKLIKACGEQHAQPSLLALTYFLLANDDVVRPVERDEVSPGA